MSGLKAARDDTGLAVGLPMASHHVLPAVAALFGLRLETCLCFMSTGWGVWCKGSDFVEIKGKQGRDVCEITRVWKP